LDEAPADGEAYSPGLFGLEIRGLYGSHHPEVRYYNGNLEKIVEHDNFLFVHPLLRHFIENTESNYLDN
jgi:hypothetical protein